MEPLILLVSLGLIPLYTSASGGIQSSHFLLSVFMLFRLVRIKWKFVSHELLLVSLLFLVATREALSLMVGNPASSLKESAYVAFAVLVVVVLSRVPLSDPSFKRGVVRGLAISVVVALLGIWFLETNWSFFEGQVTRSVGTFNNPNQLGYFAVCVGSVSSLFYLRRSLGRPAYLAFLAAILVLVVASLSKAAMLGAGMAALFGVATVFNRDRFSPAVMLACSILIAAVLLLYRVGALDSFNFVDRLERIGSDRDDNLAARGYIIPSSFELVFGMGQSGVTKQIGHEVHSTFWSFMVKYGLVGFALFTSVWVAWTSRIYREHGLLGLLLIVMPPTLYGISHNGSRFVILWILIGLSFNPIRCSHKRVPQLPDQPRSSYSP